MKAMNRLDLTSLWRALIRRPSGKKDGPVVELLAPRNTAPTDALPRLTAAEITTPAPVPADGTLEFTFPPDTTPSDLVTFAVNLVQASNTLGVTGEWQWTVRKKGLVPK